MWNDLSHGFSVLADALAFLSRSWGFWVCAGSVAGLAAVYAWWRKRLALWAFVLAFLSLLAVVGLACRQAVCQKTFLWIHEPDLQALSGKYEVESSPRERWFFRPPELKRFFHVSSSTLLLNEDGTCEISSFPRPEAWGRWISRPEERENLSVLEEDLVSSCRGTWSLVKKGGYYGISVVYSSGGSLTLYPGGEGAECLVMPVNPADPLEAVTFEKTF